MKNLSLYSLAEQIKQGKIARSEFLMRWHHTHRKDWDGREKNGALYPNWSAAVPVRARGAWTERIRLALRAAPNLLASVRMLDRRVVEFPLLPAR